MKTRNQTSSGRFQRGATPKLTLGRVLTIFLAAAILAAFGVETVRADRVAHNVAAGFLKVDLIPGFVGPDHNSNAVVTLTMSVNGFQADSAWNTNRSDHIVKIGAPGSDDVTNGIMIASVAAQNGRNNYGSNLFHITGIEPLTNASGVGYYEIKTFGVPVNASSSPALEDNVNVAAAWFPYTEFFGGVAFNSSGLNDADLDTFIGTPGLVLGTHVVDLRTDDATISGRTLVDLREFGINSQTDGVLLVNHAKNEANYALAEALTDGTWEITIHDSRTDAANFEQDPIAFVFVPKSNTNLISGRFHGSATGPIISLYSGASPQFSVSSSPLGGRTNVLKITGHSPDTGILIVSPCGGTGLNQDNIVTYQTNAANDGWIIGSRDLPGNANYQDMNTSASNQIVSFVFIPVEKPGFTVSPTNNLLTTESGGTAQFDVVLNGYPKPTANVTVSVTSSDPTEGTMSASTLTFTPSDWNVPKTVTITGVDDALVDGRQPYTIVLGASSSTDTKYNNLDVPDVSVFNGDNEPGVTVDTSNVETLESGTISTYQIWLNTAPTDDVTLLVSSSDTTEATVSPGSITFTPGDYGAKTVTVTGIDDPVVDGDVAYTLVNGVLTSTDATYNGLNPADVSGINIDNDVPGINIVAVPLSISESNSTASFSVVLATQPSANVTIQSVSGDLTEATVTPSLVFTPANWNIPQSVTVTAVDDFDIDGTISFFVTNTAASADAAYAATDPIDIQVSTLDNEAVLTLPSDPMDANTQAKGIDGHASLVDPDTAEYNNGSLDVAITAGGDASDQLGIRNDGTAPGLIGVSGATISYGGTAIGTFSGGAGGTPLEITFNANSTREAVQALARAITYHTTDANAANETRTISMTFSDGKNGAASVATKTVVIRRFYVYEFQQESDGGFGIYTNAADVQIGSKNFPSATYPQGYSASGLWIDYDPLLGIESDRMKALLRFTNIFGTGPGQIPPGSKIVHAELVLNVANTGHGTRLNRMLMDWDPESATWDFFTDGIAIDGVEAGSGTNSFLGDQANNTTTGSGLRQIGVTHDVQAWMDGANNYGWVMSPWEGGANGTAFSPCEYTNNVMLRPKLRVAWLPASVSSASFRQGESAYAGASDTHLREVNPTTSYATATVLTSDYLVSATPIPNQQEPLLRFDGVIGASAGQVPANATIHAAFIDLTSITSASQGDGGMLCAMLQPWADTQTWDFWVSGITNDGVEAAIVQTTDIGPSDPTQEPIRSTVNSFEVTADVQAWASGTRANYGWVILPWINGNDGWGFNSAEAADTTTRPKLRVYFEQGVVLGSPVHNGTNVQVPFSGVEGRTYSVERTDDLVNGPWTDIGSATVTGGTATFQDNAPLAGQAFYRVVYP